MDLQWHFPTDFPSFHATFRRNVTFPVDVHWNFLSTGCSPELSNGSSLSRVPARSPSWKSPNRYCTAQTGRAPFPFMNLDGPLKSDFSTSPEPTARIHAVACMGHPSANIEIVRYPIVRHSLGLFGLSPPDPERRCRVPARAPRGVE